MTKTVRRLLTDLGYRCHTPAAVFGSRDAALGVEDITWLARIKDTGWVVLNRDAKIMERPDELAAYRAARVHMFYLPGEATSAQLKLLVETHLRTILTCASDRTPDVWRITDRGVERFVVAQRRRRQQR